MTTEKLYEALGDMNEQYVQQARQVKKVKRPRWMKWGAMAACFALVLTVGISHLTNLIGPRGGPDQNVDPLHVIEFNGAYYEALNMEDTTLLDTYNLPHNITEDMVGKKLGWAFTDDENGEQTTEMIYQYMPYAEVTEMEDGRTQRAVYVISDNSGYAFLLFTNYLQFDSNTHQEASEMFAVYGVDSADDLRSGSINGKEVTNSAEIERLFDALCNAQSMGNDDYQEAVYGNMSQAEQQRLSEELADSMIEIQLMTTNGLVINNLRYYPTIGYVSWAFNYYKLTSSITLE